MKKTITVKIKIDETTEKEFTVNELTVAQIIELSQSNPLFGATLNDSEENTGNDQAKAQDDKKEGDSLTGDLLTDIVGLTNSAGKVMEIACDFETKDLKALAPSDVQIIFSAFKEANSTFLSFLDQLGILGITKEILKRALSDFSKTLAI